MLPILDKYQNFRWRMRARHVVCIRTDNHRYVVIRPIQMIIGRFLEITYTQCTDVLRCVVGVVSLRLMDP